jgi:hypothetical protein
MDKQHIERHLLRVVLAVATTIIFAGCALQPPVPPAPVPAPVAVKPRSAADDLLAEISRLQKMSPSELAQTRESAREIFERDNATFRRMFYALTIFVAPMSSADDDRLLGLLEPVVNRRVPTEDADQTVAQLAYNATLARKKARDDAAASRPKTTVVGRRDDREPEVRALKSRVEELEKQLLALKSIDRSVSHR